jgi:hypothetical protein
MREWMWMETRVWCVWCVWERETYCFRMTNEYFSFTNLPLVGRNCLILYDTTHTHTHTHTPHSQNVLNITTQTNTHIYIILLLLSIMKDVCVPWELLCSLQHRFLSKSSLLRMKLRVRWGSICYMQQVQEHTHSEQYDEYVNKWIETNRNETKRNEWNETKLWLLLWEW